MLSCLLLEDSRLVWLAIDPQYRNMIIPYTLQVFLRRLSFKGQDSNRIFNAMMQATRGSIEYIQSRKVCDFLVMMKKCKLGTNEFGVRRTCHLLNSQQQQMIKMKIMRKKIGDAFTELAKKKLNNGRIWREAKKIVTGDIRVKYLNRWRDFIAKFKHQMIVKNTNKVIWAKKKWLDKEKIV